MPPLSRKLLVEGVDDLHVVCSLCNIHHIPDTFSVIDKKGIDNITGTLSTELKTSDLDALGIVVDADTDLEARWQSLRSILTREGYLIARQPNPNGTILYHEDKPRVGIWLMPNNQLPGMLEDFIAALIPDGDILWPYAQRCVQTLPEQRFPEVHRAKANIHTWLAWQEAPGRPFGQAITAQYLTANSDNAQQFVNWLQRLFID